MYARAVTVALLLCVALALPVAADAGECRAVVVYFQAGADHLNIVNLGAPVAPLQFSLYSGTSGSISPLASTSVTLFSYERLRTTATDVYALFGLKPKALPGFTSSWVAIFESPADIAVGASFFSATVSHADVMREPGCIGS